MGATSSNPNVVLPTNVLFTEGVPNPGTGVGTNVVRIVPSGAAIGSATVAIYTVDANNTTSVVQTVSVNVTQVPQPVFGNTNAITIADNTAGTPYPSIVSVSNVVGLVGRIHVSLTDLEHANPDDIGVLLVSPDNRAVVLMRGAGGTADVGGGENDIRLTFEHTNSINGATVSQISNDGPLTTSTNRPRDEFPAEAFPAPAPGPTYSLDLESFQGSPANGDWKLYVIDRATGSAGSITGGWVLKIFPAPVINNIAQQTLEEGNAATAQGIVPIVPTLVNSITVPVTFSDADGAVTNVTARVVGPAIIAIPGVNSGGDLVFTIAPGTTTVNLPVNTVGDQNGTSLIRLIATDNSGKHTNINTVSVVVTPVNDPPRQEVIPRQITQAGTPTTPFDFDIFDLETAFENLLQVTVSSDNTKLLPAGSVVLGGTDRTRTIQLFPAGTTAGSANVSVTVTDPDGRSSTQTFLFNATDAPNPLYEQTTQIQVRDNDSAVPYPSVINVTGLVGNIAEVKATLHGVSHAKPDDLNVMLVSPTGDAVILVAGAGGASSINNTVLVFQQGAPSLPDNGPIVSGTYSPTQYEDSFPFAGSPDNNTTTLASMVGDNPNGDWRLFVRDDAATGAGTITQWSLSIRTRPQIGDIGDAGTPGILTTPEDTPKTTSIVIGDPQPGVNFNIVVRRISGSPVVYDADGTPTSDDFTYTLSGNRLILTLKPVANTSGENVLELEITDPSTPPFTTTKQFTFRVTAVDDPPTITAIDDTSTPAAQPKAITFNVSQPGDETGTITTSATSSDERVVPNGNLTIETLAGTPNRRLTITPAGLESGATTIRITASDSTGQTSTEEFRLTVTPTAGGINPSRIVITHFGAAAPYPSELTVSGVVGTVNNVKVILDGFSHTFPDDVDVLLQAPTGEKILLMSDAGGNSDISNARFTFRTGGSALPDETLITTGEYAPSDYNDTLGGNDLFPSPAPPDSDPAYLRAANALDSLKGKNPNGTWRLFVRDDTSAEAGEITRGWILVVQTGPTITDVQTQTTAEDTPLVVNFSVGDQDSTADQLTVTATRVDSGDFHSGLLTPGGLTLVKSGFNYTLTILPSTNRPFALNATETNQVVLAVTDETGASVNDTFLVRVTAVDDAPTVTTPDATITINEDNSRTITFRVSDADSTLRKQDIIVTSSNTDLVANPPASAIAGPDTVTPPANATPPLAQTDYNVTIAPRADANGQTVISFTIHDQNGAGSSGRADVTLNVTPLNDPPFIGDFNQAPTLEAGTTKTFNFMVTDKFNETPPENINVTVTSSNPGLIPQGNVVLGGSGTNRTVTLTALNNTGTSDLTITATDDTTPTPGITTKVITVTVTESPVRVHSNLGTITIRDNNTANPYPSTITVPSGSIVGVLQSLEVVIDGLQYSFPDDVDILLVGPTGKKVILMSDAGNGSAVSGVRLTFNDSGAAVPDESAITTGTFRPTNYNNEGTNDVFTGSPSGTIDANLATFLNTDP
jgi:subtilisin-like proprotein convertase family protein